MSRNLPANDVSGVAAILARTQAHLSSYLVHHRPDLDPHDLNKLGPLYGRYPCHLDRFLNARYLVTADPSWAERFDSIRQAGGLDACCDGITSRTSTPEPPCQYIPLRTLMDSVYQEEGDTQDDH
jgi:hypothetical protein